MNQGAFSIIAFFVRNMLFVKIETKKGPFSIFIARSFYFLFSIFGNIYLKREKRIILNAPCANLDLKLVHLV